MKDRKKEKHYVILGNGAAAAGCIEGIRAADKKGKITVVSAENKAGKSRLPPGGFL